MFSEELSLQCKGRPELHSAYFAHAEVGSKTESGYQIQ